MSFRDIVFHQCFCNHIQRRVGIHLIDHLFRDSFRFERGGDLFSAFFDVFRVVNIVLGADQDPILVMLLTINCVLRTGFRTIRVWRTCVVLSTRT